MCSMLFFDLPRKKSQITEGVVHCPDWLELDRQRQLVEEFREIARSLAHTPLAMRQPRFRHGQMSVHMLHLGWYWEVNPYRYVDSVDGHPVPPLPPHLAELAKQAMRDAAAMDPDLAPWAETYRPDMALINYYPPGASMGIHQDANEKSPAPIVSLSIGDEAKFRIGSTEHMFNPWDEVTLLSGDLIVFGGPKRMAYHSVNPVREGTLPAGCGLKEGRINVTFRQLS